jgi:DNA-binding IclR family transcriptional regulator
MFDVDRHTIHIEDVVSLFGVGLSTGYRYLRELVDAGFLTQLGKGNYSLGPRIFELERLAQLTDPLLRAGRAAMSDLLPADAVCAALLCTLYRDRVLCVHHVGAEEITQGSTRMAIQQARGIALPLFSGAGSQIILANLKPHRIRSLYLGHTAAIAEAGLGENWFKFRANLANMRNAGFAESIRSVEPQLYGIAVPVFRADDSVVGSLLLLTLNKDAERQHARQTMLPLLIRKSGDIRAQLTHLEAASEAPATRTHYVP